jgi:hypothetical protein
MRIFRHGHEVVNATQKFAGTKSQAGIVPNVVGSRGFLETTSAMQLSVGVGHHDEGVMNALAEGKQREAAIAARRHELEQRPFQTEEPKHWVKSTQAHCDMVAVAERSTLMTKPGKEGRNRGGTNADGPRGDTAITIHSRRGLQQTLTAPEPGSEQDLREMLDAHRAAQRAALEHPKNTTCIGWRSTTHDIHDEVDVAEVTRANDRWCPQPALHASQRGASEATRAQVEALELRHQLRHEGHYQTETSVNLTDRSRDVVVDPRFHAKGTFSLQNGVSRMNPLAHHPREVKTGHDVNPNSVVPNQFTTTTHSTLAASAALSGSGKR